MSFQKINQLASGLFDHSDLISRASRQVNQRVIDQAMTASRLSERIADVSSTIGSHAYRTDPARWIQRVASPSTTANYPWFDRVGERAVAELGSGVLGRLTDPRLVDAGLTNTRIRDLALRHSFASSANVADAMVGWSGISGLASRQVNQHLLVNQRVIDQAMTASRLSERIADVSSTIGSHAYRTDPARWIQRVASPSTTANYPWFDRVGERAVAELGSGVLGRLTDPRLVDAGLTNTRIRDLALRHSFASSANVADAISRFQRRPFFGGITHTARMASLFQRMDQLEEELGTGDPAAARLAVLLRHVGVGRALEMMELMVADGPKPLIEVLGEVLLEEQAHVVFETAVAKSDLPTHIEEDLCHAFEHLREEEYGHAFPPLLTGLEGALRHTARMRGDRKRRSNARAVAAVLGVEKDHELLIGMIYGEANEGRHGENLDRHAACVLALVGLVIWIDSSLNAPAIRWLGRKLDHRLHSPEAIAA